MLCPRVHARRLCGCNGSKGGAGRPWSLAEPAAARFCIARAGLAQPHVLGPTGAQGWERTPGGNFRRTASMPDLHAGAEARPRPPLPCPHCPTFSLSPPFPLSTNRTHISPPPRTDRTHICFFGERIDAA